MKRLNATLLISSSNHLIKYAPFYFPLGSTWFSLGKPEGAPLGHWEAVYSGDQIIDNHHLAMKHATRAVGKGRQYFVSWEVHGKQEEAPPVSRAALGVCDMVPYDPRDAGHLPPSTHAVSSSRRTVTAPDRLPNHCS